MDSYNFMAEVDEQIKKILNKSQNENYKENIMCSVTNLEPSLKALQEELDYFNVSALDDSLVNFCSKKSLKAILIQLINSTFNLISLHRETLNQLNQVQDKNTKLSQELNYYKSCTDTLQRDLSAKKTETVSLRERQTLDQSENDNLKCKLSNLRRQMVQKQKEFQALENRRQNEIRKLLMESRHVEELVRNQCGQYVSHEERFTKVINDYKANEDKHMKIIKKLQANNQELVERVLVLQNEINQRENENKSETLVDKRDESGNNSNIDEN